MKSQYLNCGIVKELILIVLIFNTLTVSFNLFAQTSKNPQRYDYFKDPTFQSQPFQIKKEGFQTSKGLIPDLGWGKFKAWIKLDPQQMAGKKYLMIQNPVFDEIAIYGTSFSQKKIYPGTLLENREVSFRYPTFKIEDVANNDVFISGIATLNPAKFPIRLFDENELDDFKEKESLRNGLILGFISVLIILNLIIFSVFRLRPFGVFALSAFLFATLYLFLEGYFFGYWYSPALFENKILNFHYLIYFGFQLSNYWIFSSVFQLEIVKTGRFYTFFRILFLIGIMEGVLMLFSPLWYDYLNDFTIKTIGMTLRIGAMVMNVLMLFILLKIKKETQLASWFLAAMIPGWLVYMVPRFLPFLFHDFWFTMPQLYSLSMVWYISLVSFGLATAVYKNLQSAAENNTEPVKKAILKSDKLSKREMDILMAFTNGFSYTEISDAMFISPHTVRTHLKNIYSKIGVNSKAEAVRWVLEETK